MDEDIGKRPPDEAITAQMKIDRLNSILEEDLNRRLQNEAITGEMTVEELDRILRTQAIAIVLYRHQIAALKERDEQLVTSQNAIIEQMTALTKEVEELATLFLRAIPQPAGQKGPVN